MSIKKIAIISDIHANIYALNAFMEYINHEQDIEIVFNLGNFIMEGPHPCEVFDTIIHDKRFINILGENEDEILKRTQQSHLDGEMSGHFDANDGRCVEDWLIERLGYNRLEKLKEFPRFKEVEFLDKKILLIHSIGGFFIGPHESSLLVRICNDINEEKTIKERLFTFDYIFYGGSHSQELSSYYIPPLSGKIIDPGALCCLNNSLAGFAVITFDGVNENISFESIEFDRNKLIHDFYHLNIPAKESFLCNNYRISCIEEILEKDETLKKHILDSGNVFIGWLKHREDGNPMINNEILRAIVGLCLKRSKFITFGCWENEKSVIDEILNTMDNINKESSDFNGQVWFTGEITQKVVDLITVNPTDVNGTFKWFELSLNESLSEEVDQFKLSMTHFANEIYLNNVTKEELTEIKSFINKNDVYYRVSPVKN